MYDYSTRQRTLAWVVWLAILPESAFSDSQKQNLFDVSLEQLMDIEVVTANRQARKLSSSIGTTFVITSDELEQLGARTIYDALSHLPGFNIDVTN